MMVDVRKASRNSWGTQHQHYAEIAHRSYVYAERGYLILGFASVL